MGRKHLKKLRAEESKVHLKKTKLPKGQNATDTAFKVKKILLIEQLKKVNDGEPVSNWNVPIKDLLNRLNHYNFTSRLNGLCGIKEVLAKYPEILQGPSLRSLVSRLLDLLTDEEHKIRMTAIDLLSYLLDMIPSSAILPFEDLLNVHLGCAMTHRDVSVQWDSLSLIDVMIKHSPGAIRHNFGSLARNFIRILKKCFNESHKIPSGGSKQAFEKSKAEMFSRFYGFMTTGFSEIGVVNQQNGNIINITSLGRKKISLRQSNSQYKLIPDLTSLFINSDNEGTTLNDKNKEEFELICSLIMPLMFETWMEYCPDQKHSGKAFECVLNDKAATLLCVLLKILLFLYERSVALEDEKMGCWFAEAYSSTFKKCFLSGFPYLETVSKNKSCSSKCDQLQSPSSSSCVVQNLIICYLTYAFKLVQENNDVGALMENYISWVLRGNIWTEAEAEVLLKVVKAVRNTSNEKHAKVVLKVVDAFAENKDAAVWRELSKALGNYRVITND